MWDLNRRHLFAYGIATVFALCWVAVHIASDIRMAKELSAHPQYPVYFSMFGKVSEITTAMIAGKSALAFLCYEILFLVAVFLLFRNRFRFKVAAVGVLVLGLSILLPIFTSFRE